MSYNEELRIMRITIHLQEQSLRILIAIRGKTSIARGRIEGGNLLPELRLNSNPASSSQVRSSSFSLIDSSKSQVSST